MLTEFNSKGLFIAFAYLGFGFFVLLNPERFRSIFLKYYHKTHPMIDLLRIGKFLYRHPRLHRFVIVSIAVAVILVGFFVLYISTVARR